MSTPEKKIEEKKADVKPVEKAQAQPTAPVAGKNATNPPVKKEAVNPAPEDGWYYHKTHEPRLIKKGEEIPEGFGPKNIYYWYKDISNNFHWRKR